jgi:hypothetical protein
MTEATESPSSNPVLEPWIFLLGRPPIEEYLGFVVQASGSNDVDLTGPAARWRAAAEVVDDLAQSEAGAADGRAASPLSEGLQERATRYLSDPAVTASYLACPPQVGIIWLDELVVFQRQINMRYAAELQALIGDWKETDERLFDFCLAVNQPQPAINGMQVSRNTFVFSSVSTDARFLEARLLDASRVAAPAPNGGKAHTTVALFVGYSVNALSVASVNGRLVLNNGSHRAYALQSAGITQVPALVQTITREDQLSAIPQVQQNAQLYLQSPRPPMLKDYFNPSLHETIQAPRRVRQIRLQFGMETSDAPG